MFLNSGSEAEHIAGAMAGAFLMVTFSDGQFEKSEEVRLRRGLAESAKFTGLSVEDLDAIFVGVQEAFAKDYDKAAQRTLELVSAVRTNSVAKRAVVAAARTAVIVDKVVTPQEENTLNRLAEALGLKEGEL